MPTEPSAIARKKFFASFFQKRSACLALILLVYSAAFAAEDSVVAQRGADHLTLSQAKALLAGVDAETRRKLAADPASLSDLLRNVLLQRAILAQAAAEHWDQRPQVAALLARTHDQVVSQSFLTAHAALPAGYPSDVEVQAAYDQNKAKFLQPRGYHLTQLFFVKAPASMAEAQKRLAAIRAQIGRGHVSLEAAAKQGPGLQFADLGWVPETQLVAAVKAAVSGTLEGAVSEPVCTDTGCHLIRLVATRPAGPAPLAELRDGLVRALRQQKQSEMERTYANTLLQKQPVAINEIELSRVVQ